MKVTLPDWYLKIQELPVERWREVEGYVEWCKRDAEAWQKVAPVQAKTLERLGF